MRQQGTNPQFRCKDGGFRVKGLSALALRIELLGRHPTGDIISSPEPANADKSLLWGGGGGLEVGSGSYAQ